MALRGHLQPRRRGRPLIHAFWRVIYALWRASGRLKRYLSGIPGRLKRFFLDVPAWIKWAHRGFRDASWVQCWRYFWARAPWAVAAVVIYYVVSPELANLWRWNQELAWVNPELTSHDLSKRLYVLHLHALVALYAITSALKSKHLLEAMAWWYLAIVETLEIAVYGACKVVADKHTSEAMNRIWELEGQTSSCERLGGSLFAYGILPLTMIVMTYLVVKAFQVWRSTTHNTSGG